MVNRYDNHERGYSSGYGAERSESERQRRRELQDDRQGFGRRPLQGIESRGAFRGRYDFDEEAAEQYRRDTGYGREGYSGTYGESEGAGYGRESSWGGAFGEVTGRGYDPGNSNIYGGARGEGSRGIVGGYYSPEGRYAGTSETARRDDRRRQGNYAGRGPKNYKRPDERIAEDINDRLTGHPDLDAADIEVRVSDGLVTLTGRVDTRQSKRLAEDLAESVSGVQDISNQLRTGQEGLQVQLQENKKQPGVREAAK